MIRLSPLVSGRGDRLVSVSRVTISPKIIQGCMIVLLTPWLATAQSTGTVQGVVKDSSGGIVRDAKVILLNNANKLATERSTNTNGGYSFVFVAPGGYTLTVEHAGFNRYLLENVLVD